MMLGEEVEGLQGLVGWRVQVVGEGMWGEVLDCVGVEVLRPRERVGDQGNVLLWDGRVDREGRPCGWTFWGRDVAAMRQVWWVWLVNGPGVLLELRNGERVLFLRRERLGTEG